MGSSSPKRAKESCLVRQKLVTATPEEGVRQRFISYLLDRGFPLSRIAVELSLKEMPHLQTAPPDLDRRADILCYTKEGSPLLLVECKACLIGQQAKLQLIGYNCFVGAFFLALVNNKELILMTKEGDPVEELDYKQLVKLSRATPRSP